MNPLYILLAILIFGFLIMIHELGHFLTARLFKVTVHEFSIGMGPKLLQKKSKKSGIAYSLRLLPIGGYVSMEGEDTESEDENAFYKKPVWQRIIVTSAGALTNILVGVLVMILLVSTQNNLLSNRIGAFIYNDEGVCYAESGGLAIGDVITHVDGTPVHIGNETFYEIMRQGIEPIDITVIRNGEKVVIKDVAFGQTADSGAVFGVMDFKVYAEEKTPLTVLKHGFFRSVSTVKMIWESLIDLITGRYSMEVVSGPVGVTKALGEAAQSGIADLVYLSVFISMNLGVMNLLPLPALDGGRLLFQFIELIRRKPVPTKIEGYVHFAGLVLLMILMVVICVKDVITLL